MNLGTNGNGSVVDHLTRSTAEMSPHERSAQADTMRRKLVELAAAHNRLVDVVDAQSKAHGNLDAAVSALIPLLQVDGGFQGIETLHRHVHGLTFLQRLRWLVLGR